METRGHVVDGRIGHHQVTLKAGFRLATEEKGGNNAGDKQEKGAIRIVAGRA
ncbi:dodecin domain-containing protein [Azohydromonas australica]|uniref:dodecin domain-containing protein n=1 Tax=Azohydromonas australica TaxID=364039 RepID=UPI001B7F9F21|nr:dodecin domain-containing protein [Azohydromonas australica]